MKRNLIVAAVLVMCGIASGEEPRVFTNDDLGTVQQQFHQPSHNVGTMNRSYNHENSDMRTYNGGRYGDGGASYNRDGSSTTYSKPVTEEDIRLLEADEYNKNMEAKERRQELERQQQLEEARQRDREDRRRVEREEQRLRYENDMLRYRNGFR